MKLSTRGKYGLYAMYYLALHQGEGPQPLQNVAAFGIPKQYLEQILGNLRRAGVVSTVRGAQGGYQLAESPENISLRDIMDAVEDPVELSECTSEQSVCSKAAECPVRVIWQKATDCINIELDKIKLADLLAKPEEAQ